jgi:hypothetical protein
MTLRPPSAAGRTTARAAGLLAALLLAGCSHRPLPQEFVVPRDAKKIAFPTVGGGGICVQFHLKALYPAEEYLRTVSARLEGASWRPLPGHFLQPESPSSHVRGWSSHLASHPEREIHQWQASWQDPSGAIVSYQLQYSSPNPKLYAQRSRPTNDDLEVLCMLLSAEQMRAINEARARLEKQ